MPIISRFDFNLFLLYQSYYPFIAQDMMNDTTLPIKARNYIVDEFLEKIELEKKFQSALFRSVELEKELLEKELQVATQELLRASGLLTSRGIFEWKLKMAFIESKGKGKFNASEMIKVLLSSTSTNSSTKTSIELMKIFTECDVYTVEDGLKLWEQLSSDIHGHAWNGPAVRIYSSQLPIKYRCVIKKIAASLAFEAFEQDDISEIF